KGGTLADTSYPPIEAHGIIGDLQTAALVGMDGTIDFLCLPAFDSPSVFAALLDVRKGGAFELRPALNEANHTQLYLPDTNVLLTRFLSADGVAEITDFMPVHADPHPSRIVRRIKMVRGQTRVRMRCAPRFDYGRARHKVVSLERGVVFESEEGTVLRLSTPVALEIDGGEVVAEFTLNAGESVPFVLEQVLPDGPVVGLDEAYISSSFKDTVNYWRTWIGQSTYRGRWLDIVRRSALTLKLLHSRWTGSFVAAPTFGLPEDVGGVRNWDYRYTWIRDASFTLYALIRMGLVEETRDFIRWLVQRTESREDPGALQIVYGIDGRADLSETTLDHFEGYRGSRPVRIGNAAFDQLQLDIYGELLDSLYMYDKYGEPTHHDLWGRIEQIVDWVCDNWNRPDEGIWEVRSERRHFLISRLMCWVAIDRGIRLAVKRSFPADLVRWRNVRNEIYKDIWENFWDPEEQAFVGHLGSKRLDAACLLMPLVRFVSPTDPHWLSTLQAVERRLVDDSLVHRYEIVGTEVDGLAGTEGTFSICSFWYVECLSRAGDIQKARFYFEKMLGYANHVGLYAEELGPRGEHLGNFPQAFTHLALISAAYDLDRRLSGAGWKA
ncbi:MAG TPA: glycoside hydrolase family 15 protein, partial [Longimicrobiaceae bacterium]